MSAPEIRTDQLTGLRTILAPGRADRPEGFGGRKMVAEAWFYPDGERILELSTKCPPAEMIDVAL